MFRFKEDDISNIYYVTAADWESIIISTNYEKAAVAAFEEIYDKLGEDMNLSPAVIVVNVTGFSETISEDNAKILPTGMILSDMGLHDLAKKLKKIIPNT